jgi:hypothetical protein
MDNAHYYIFLLVTLIVGCYIIKKVASCLVKTIVLLVLLAILALAYLELF